jgi:hypothetical protein
MKILKKEPKQGQILYNGYEVVLIEKTVKKYGRDIVKFHTLFLQKGSKKRVAEFNDRKMIVEPFKTTEICTGSKQTSTIYKSW